MVLLVRLRTWLARHPAVVWWFVAVSAAVAAWGVVGAVHRLEDERRAWGEEVTVWVAAHDTSPGEPIEARAEHYPQAVVASSALRRDPAGLIALQHVGAGEVVSNADVGRSGLELLPAAWRGVSIAVADTASWATVGGSVDVVAAGRLLVEEAVVIAVTDRAVTVGVPAELAAAVADAARLDEVSLVLRAD